MDSITYIYLKSLSVFRSDHKVLSNTLSNLDGGQRPGNRTTDYTVKLISTHVLLLVAFLTPPAQMPLHDVPPSRGSSSPPNQPLCMGDDATEIRHCLCLFLLLLVLPVRNPCIQITANYSEISLHPLTAAV